MGYVITQNGPNSWTATHTDHAPLRGSGVTHEAALRKLDKEIDALGPHAWLLYETTGPGMGDSNVCLGVALTEADAEDWVAQNNPQKTWRDRSFTKKKVHVKNG